ncbi:MAG: AAA family ATPase [Oscillospiraceae bacterium]|nr:AAA family ATPase [Oscillospiraceae bacterium]
MTDTIEGVVSNIVYNNAENGYTVLRLDTVDGVVTATGNLPGVISGERLVLSGIWMTHPQYGEQFKLESFEVKQPTDTDEIFRYLASGAIKNIGVVRAREIVDRFGSEALHIIENEPDKLSVLKGISLRTARKIGDNYRRQAGLRRLIDFFARYGIKPLIATRVYKDYGNDSLEAVRDNPYLIASKSYGAGFFEADSIAIDLGFNSDCIERLSAALIFQLVHNMGNGHVFIPKSKLTAAVSELLSVDGDVVADALDTLCEYGDIVISQIAGVEGCYLQHMFEAECYVAERLLQMINDKGQIINYREFIPPSTEGGGARHRVFLGAYETQRGLSGRGTGSKEQRTNSRSGNNKVLGFIKDIEQEQGIKYARLQREALELAAGSDVMALTGGPGTGKTTTVRGIIKFFDAIGLKTVLCAPTGRAAKRLSELCGNDAATVHRLLGASLDEELHVFEHNEDNPLDADAVIVDESSMIDIELMSSLLRALKDGCRLIMIGDADQLPPVGPGSMFSDVIKSGVIPVIALTEIFRQAQYSGIIKCAHDVNNGIIPDLSAKYPDFFFMRRQNDEQLAETVAELCSKRLPENMGVNFSQIQVLSPTRKRAAGTFALNQMLQEKLNPHSTSKKEKQSGDFLFRTGDKVMQIRNNYDIIWESPDKRYTGAGVFNGDIGVIKSIDHDDESLVVDFEDKLVKYSFDKLPELEPAYAMTVHKSQGSEYHTVILAMTSAASMLLSRSVLYTAMTRAKSLLIIVGSPDIMAKMVQNDKKQRRYSGLRARLADG